MDAGAPSVVHISTNSAPSATVRITGGGPSERKTDFPDES
jgi:hypothetical protein